MYGLHLFLGLEDIRAVWYIVYVLKTYFVFGTEMKKILKK